MYHANTVPPLIIEIDTYKLLAQAHAHTRASDEHVLLDKHMNLRMHMPYTHAHAHAHSQHAYTYVLWIGVFLEPSHKPLHVNVKSSTRMRMWNVNAFTFHIRVQRLAQTVKLTMTLFEPCLKRLVRPGLAHMHRHRHTQTCVHTHTHTDTYASSYIEVQHQHDSSLCRRKVTKLTNAHTRKTNTIYHRGVSPKKRDILIEITSFFQFRSLSLLLFLAIQQQSHKHVIQDSSSCSFSAYIIYIYIL